MPNKSWALLFPRQKRDYGYYKKTIPDQNENVEFFEDKTGLLRSVRNDDPIVFNTKPSLRGARGPREGGEAIQNPCFSFMMSIHP